MRLLKTHPVRLLATFCLVINLAGGTLLLQACGDQGRIALLRSTLRASPALIQPLVARGVITQAQANGAIKDFTDGGDVALGLAQDLDAIPANAPNKKQLQFQAVHKAFDGWRAIVARGHFTVHRDIETAFTIADGIWVFVDSYYADQAGQSTHTDVGADGLSEQEFKDALDQKIKDLKAAMKPTQ